MAEVRIYQPAKTAMQSGRANMRKWVLEFDPTERKTQDPLMGWAGSGDTATQLRMRFETKEEAIAYAEKNGLIYRVMEPKTRRIKPKAYADNFSYDRVESWTH